MRTEADNFLNMLRKEIGESIVDSRRQKQITQRELAAMCGISERMLRLLENGERRYGLDIYLLLSAAGWGWTICRDISATWCSGR